LGSGFFPEMGKTMSEWYKNGSVPKVKSLKYSVLWFWYELSKWGFRPRTVHRFQ
jgi:hypothetical protein